uniref:Uncharacterized protein n=1 Tax=Cyclopterus lumpus TaxID=8103 RepID=A0A8C3AKX1_CYCLU
MAAASSPFSEDQFLCSICLDVFSDPVTIPCGHNFCKACITEHWAIHAHSQCPMCKELFDRRPALQVNTFISEIATQFSQSKAELGATEAAIQQMIQERQLKIAQIKQAVELNKEGADKETEGVLVFTAMMQSVERGLAELIETIDKKHKTTAEGFIKELEEEISELMVRRSELEQLSRTDDHLHLLQSFSSLSPVPHSKDWTTVKVQSSYLGTARRAVAQLHETLSREMMKLCADVELKRAQQFALDVTLDLETAHQDLILSDDGKQVSQGDKQQYQGFYCTRCVSSGRFYYEVQVKGKTDWIVGVVRRSVHTGSFFITASPENGYWTVHLMDGNQYARTDPATDLVLKSTPQKVGVFVDHEEGLVSFYDVDTAALIYSFTGCNFTEKLCPYLNPKHSNEANPPPPLIICSINPAD